MKKALFLFLFCSFFAMSQCVEGDCKNGYGVYKFSEESYYDGNWKNGLRHGFGLDYAFDSINKKTGKKAFTKRLGVFEYGFLIEGTKEWYNGIFPNKSTYTYESFIGKVKSKINLIEWPTTDSDIIKSLNSGAEVFIISDKTVNGYYNVIDKISAEEGYIDEKFIDLLNEVENIKRELFNPSGLSNSIKTSELLIFNDAEFDLNIKIAGLTHKISPKKTKKISVKPGEYTIFAWHTGAIPYKGKQTIEPGQNYEKTFIIVYN